MKQKLLQLTLAVLFASCFTVLNAQESIVASGGDATGSGGSASFSVGQMVYTTYTSTAGSIAQGVQQSFEFTTLGIEDNLINLSLIAFPNPTSNVLTLKIKDYSLDNMYYRLYDIQGRILIQNKLTDFTTNLPTQNLVPAIYFLRVTNQNKVLKTFKIIKN